MFFLNSAFKIIISFSVEPGVSGQFYALLGDKEKVFAPMRFLGFNIYLHDKGKEAIWKQPIRKRPPCLWQYRH